MRYTACTRRSKRFKKRNINSGNEILKTIGRSDEKIHAQIFSKSEECDWNLHVRFGIICHQQHITISIYAVHFVQILQKMRKIFR